MAYTKTHASPYVKLFMPSEMLKMLKETAEARALSQQHIMRTALAQYLAKHGPALPSLTMNSTTRQAGMQLPLPLPPPRPMPPPRPLPPQREQVQK